MVGFIHIFAFKLSHDRDIIHVKKISDLDKDKGSWFHSQGLAPWLEFRLGA